MLTSSLRLRRIATVAATVACVVAVVASVVLLGYPRVRLPAPSGPDAVGTAVLEWTDDSRPESATPDPSDHRTVVAQLWYPTTQTAGARLPLLGRDREEADAVAHGVADLFGVPSFALNRARRGVGHAVADATLKAGSRFPVLLFSPGLLGVRTQNTALAEDLASHWFVVVALDHPYDSAAVMVDGQVRGTAIHSTGDDATDKRRADEATRVRAAELRFALDQLAALDRDPASGFSGGFDLARVTVAGHSLGGAAALLAAADDSCFRAVIDIDGFPRLPKGRAVHLPRMLALVAGDGTGNAQSDHDYDVALQAALARARAGSRIVTVPGAGHLGFTDAGRFLPPIPALIGHRSPNEMLTTTSTLIREFIAGGS